MRAPRQSRAFPRALWSPDAAAAFPGAHVARTAQCSAAQRSTAQRRGSVRAAPNGDGTDRTTAALMLSRAFAHARTLITERAVL